MRALFALFIRAVREDLRARLPPILRTSLVLIILLILWANERDFTRHSAPGREFLGMVLFANLGLLAIATPGIFASAITEEKEDQTLTLLRMTRLSPLAILFGKGTSRMFSALLLLAAQIPFTILAVTLGGVSLAQVLQGYAVLGATLFFLCNLALVCSVFCRTGLRAGVWSGIIIGVIFVLAPMVSVATSLRNGPPGTMVPQNAWDCIAVGIVEANPVYTLAMLLFERRARAIPGTNLPIHVWLNLAGGVLCFLIAWLAFDRFCATAGEDIARKRKSRFFGFLARTRRRPSCKRPLAWKEFHFSVGGCRGLLIRIGICALILFGLYAFERWVDHSWNPEPEDILRDTGRSAMVCAFFYFAFEISLLASRIFGDERRHLTLGTLMTLPKQAGWMIRQKVFGCLPAIIPSALLFTTGVLMELAWSSSGHLILWELRRDDWSVFRYFGSQALLLPVLIAWLSLKLRRGAMPAGISIVVAANVLIAVFIESVINRDYEHAFVGVAAFCSVWVALTFAVLTRRSLPQVAAAE